MSATSRAGRAMQARYVVGGATVLFWYERREPVQRTHDFANEVGGHLGVARRRVELGMPGQDLNHANVDVLLQQMGGEAVAQLMRRHHLGSNASSAAMWKTRLSWRVVIG